MTIRRNIVKQIKRYQKMFPIIAITGPRQSGKTTMLKNEFPNYTYLNLENPDTREYALTDPKSFLAEYSSKIILDEVQRAPILFSYLQSIVDESGKMGEYILSGSQNFQLLQNITQTLAGRVAIFKLLPFDFTELKSANLLGNKFAKVATRGFYPAIYDRKIPNKVYYDNYIQTYVERDVGYVLNIKDLSQFKKFIRLCAGRCGQLLNLNSLANDCGISQPTAKSWLTVLESSYIVFLMQPFYNNYSKRIIKTPKLYFYDTGLLCHLLRFFTEDKLSNSQMKGQIFENFIIAEKLKQNYHNYLQQDFWFWRDTGGREIDLMIQTDEKADIYEIKSTTTISSQLFKHLNFFEELTKNLVKNKILIYGGNENQKRNKTFVKGWVNC